MPPELQNAERRRQAIKEAMAELKKEAEAQGPEEPLAKAQRNFTDSESRIMRSGEGAFIQGYNGQAAVDAKHQIIVAADLNNQAADSVQLSRWSISSVATWAATPNRSPPTPATVRRPTLLHCTGHNLCKLQAVWG